MRTGRCPLEGEITRRGIGVVLRGHDPDLPDLNRTLAVKVPKPARPVALAPGEVNPVALAPGEVSPVALAPGDLGALMRPRS